MSHDNWATPPEVYNPLNKEFGFDFDPCPLHSNFNGLSLSWGKKNFVNPPYNRKLKPLFIEKAYQEHLKGNLSVLLIPVKTGTKHFHKYIYPHAEIRFVEGRIKFIENGTTRRESARDDSMIVIFRGIPMTTNVENERFPSISETKNGSRNNTNGG